ncbi:hypothetical protein SAMN04489761_3885 [Tenacibaculum sp. MAR_2009_124]|uniref:hypothetical protein n=1 Tax=Tenacibaculum sp. MAR_2009_124 TaxID=1250059 RepID=UPI00089D14C1|nr:hypothetical protein [Tenacibaculum sp. MAR_2009_124]SEC89172.1 hypothetical protein SAMN04489761_3885 [Tenacibaculum sp. MAR_2009_124]
MVKCKHCGVFTENSDYCKNCGALISFKKERELRVESFKQQQIDEAKLELENPSFAIRLMQHPNFLCKIGGWILHSVFLVISAIGAFLAWFIAMVAAG